MEELINEGKIDAVLDLTLHELTEEVMGVGAYVPVTPNRLEPALRKSIPVVMATGGMEYLCFGPRSSIPAELQDRVIYMHNPYNANLKINSDELERVADTLAERVNVATAGAALFVPRKGWSVYGGEGGPFHDPQGIERFIKRLEDRLDANVEFRVLDNNINDDEFVIACVERLQAFIKQRTGAIS
jgi:uncharacterized protein (UPF0261 family)